MQGSLSDSLQKGASQSGPQSSSCTVDQSEEAPGIQRGTADCTS